MPENHPKRPLTMWDIARSMGVSQSTVSRALRNDRQISKPVREKVQAAAKDFGYRPNPYVAAFTAQVRAYRKSPSSPTIAVLDSFPRSEKSDEYISPYIEGAIQRAKDLGFSIDVLRLSELDNSLRTFNRVIWARSINGLLVLPVPENLDLSELNFEHLAAATLDTSLHKPALHRATPDYFHGMQLAFETLQAKGYQRIGFTSDAKEQHRIGDRWLGAYMESQLRLRATKLPPFIPTDYNRSGLEKWIIKNRPDAIISNMSLHYRWLRELKIPVPSEIAWASLSASHDFPEMSGIDQRGGEVGAAGIDLVVGQIYRNEYGLTDVTKSVSVRSCWVERSTTPDRHEPQKTSSRPAAGSVARNKKARQS